MAAFIGTLRAQAALRTTPVFVLGDFGAATGPNAQTIARETGMLAAVAASADPLLFGIPNSTATPESWIRGTGRVGAAAGNGNADLYINTSGTHHNHAGSMWYARRIADAVAALVARFA
jgi:hypothetical protein